MDAEPQSDRLETRPYSRIAVIGAGAWGTALASVGARAGHQVRLIGRDPAVVDAINRTARNPRYLQGIPLPNALKATTDPAEALVGADAVLLVVPSVAVRETARQVRALIPAGTPVAVCTKGIEPGTGLLMSQVVAEELRDARVGAISGPTFARETALGHFTAATVAFDFTHADRLDPYSSPAARLALSMSTGFFKAYISDDLVGVEIGGAVKNVIAIACGMMTGAGFAENTRAALITRGMDEMKQLAEALGGRRETVTGLAGAGDLTLTCSSQTSRNMSLGVQLGQGTPRAACFDGKPVVVEGEVNAVSIVELARRLKVSIPICETVHSILHGGADIGQAFAELWTRPIQGEPRALDILLSHPAQAGQLTGGGDLA
ncbi:NAD(P)H-dependent glycerol-3-phosphate dehydrogenase [Seohaeicola zhoushanensis]|uniref:Glycerol-3-phosphate dehydrogenase [NAD(P)+] n=1 Tax=Seohaeicola zhoushanensis TaxID=1569283 RepID=A0A8J3H3R5_9RHOB|nr:NAD(P)H-dependent glycerol-3-phosphate dehydrogenase [Seohaeicola zhoushanensis]GHF74317.1 glycerol-3-phosphate dehydrogenase [NAD(P)+] [Seohaeicola zhoushanensis]